MEPILLPGELIADVINLVATGQVIALRREDGQIGFWPMDAARPEERAAALDIETVRSELGRMADALNAGWN